MKTSAPARASAAVRRGKARSARLLAIAAIGLLWGASGNGTDAATDAGTGWSATAAADLAAIHDLLAANAAFTATPRDGGAMRAWLRTGLREGLRRSAKVRSRRDYQQVLNAYIAGFDDPHLALQYDSGPAETQLPETWPGISTRWRDGRYEVAYVATAVRADAPPVGAVLAGCGRTAVDALAAQSFRRFGVAAEPHARFRLAPQLLWNWGGSSAGPPTRCTFRMGSKSRRWRLPRLAPAADEIRSARAAGAFAPAATAGVGPWGDGTWWIGIPRLHEGDEWLALEHSVDRVLTEVRRARLLVIDVRGNRGGNSALADRLVERIWGEAMAKRHAPREGAVLLRTGPLVRQWLQRFAPAELASFDRAAAAGSKTLRLAGASPAASAEVRNPVAANVVVLTDHACISSCLMFVDRLLRLPNVRQAGTETAADTIFGEVATARLPSGAASLHLPIKAWSERPRPSRRSIRPAPALTWRGDLRDSPALLAWLQRAAGRPAGSPSKPNAFAAVPGLLPSSAGEARMIRSGMLTGALAAAGLFAGPAASRADEGEPAPQPVIAGRPNVVATSPANGQTISPGPIILKVTFDRPMRDGSYSFVRSDEGEFPACHGAPRLSPDRRTYAWDCTVAANRQFVVLLNKAPYLSFTSAAEGVPAMPHRLQFATRPE